MFFLYFTLFLSFLRTDHAWRHVQQVETFQSILIPFQVCAAAKKKSLAGLDNIAAEGSEGFDAMDGLIQLLAECGEFSTVLIHINSCIFSLY